MSRQFFLLIFLLMTFVSSQDEVLSLRAPKQNSLPDKNAKKDKKKSAQCYLVDQQYSCFMVDSLELHTEETQSVDTPFQLNAQETGDQKLVENKENSVYIQLFGHDLDSYTFNLIVIITIQIVFCCGICIWTKMSENSARQAQERQQAEFYQFLFHFHKQLSAEQQSTPHQVPSRSIYTKGMSEQV